MNRREYLKLMGLGAAAVTMPACLTIAGRTAAKRPPNILLM